MWFNYCDKEKKELYTFYHGKLTQRISHITFLHDGFRPYDNMFEEHKQLVLDSSSTSSSSHVNYRLKDIYYCSIDSYLLGRDIKLTDLRRTDHNNDTLTSGRQMLSRAKEAVNNIKKALYFKRLRLNIEKMEPIKSGDTKEDIIMFVRNKMWVDYMSQKKNSSY